MMNKGFPNQMAGNQVSLLQMLQQLRQNPVQFLKNAGFDIPANMNDPNAIIQYLMNSGKVSQDQYNQARMMAQKFKMQ